MTQSVLGFAFSLLMAFGPAAAYIPQYRLISQSKNADGFSLWVTAILIWSSILRIFFWFGARFEVPLLVQSVMMVLMQLILLELCVHLRSSKKYSGVGSPTSASIGGRDADDRPVRNVGMPQSPQEFLENFWAWESFNAYVIFLALLVAGLAALQLLLGDSPSYVALVGFAALGMEAMLGVPQVYSNYRAKATDGLSYFLIATWVGGDIFKTIYYSVNANPVQFIVCGAVQIVVDLVIVSQMYIYR